jgi:cyclopropane-fatty-acyl-phospholipid synthase
MDAARLATELFGSPSCPFPVQLWTGAEIGRGAGAASPRARVLLRSPRAVEAFLPPTSEADLAAAFIEGDLDIEGDLTGLLEAAARWEGPRPTGALIAATGVALVHRATTRARASTEACLRGTRHSAARDAAAIHHHYDVSDDFYRLFLDRDMVYSCALFERGDETLEEAQRAKHDLVCRKLALAPGDRLLDVGCGWGALLEHAARRYGARGTGITVSRNQLEATRRRLAEVAPGQELTVAGDDYRTLRADVPFDKVASIGMMEHVGLARLDTYFQTVFRLLRPGGLFLNHAIADGAPGVPTVPWASRRGGGFIARHIFPDGEILPVSAVVSAAERAGFEVRDLDSLREHYERTVLAWLARLEARTAEAEALVGRARTRAWRLYLAGSAVAFRLGRNTVFQLLLAKRSAGGRADGLPLTRAGWYAAAR